jgi:hypothetical protein
MIASLLIAATALIAASAFVAAAPAQAAPPPSSVSFDPGCARPPVIEVGRAFGGRKDAADLVRINFTTAYLRACFKGVLRGRALIRPGSVFPEKLFLKNASEANVASIYQEEKDGRPGRMVLEYPFFDRGVFRPPSADELEEAIVCAVRGASAAEQEVEGRCLPD